jgi:hypothetical protein
VYEDILNRLAEATNEELNAALTEIGKQSGTFTGPPTADSATKVAKLASDAAAIRGQLDANARVEAEYAANMSMIGELTAQPEQPAQPETPEVPEQQPEALAVEAVEEPPAEPDGEKPEGGDTVTASARRPLGGVGLLTGRGRSEFRALELPTRVTGQNGLRLSSDPEEAREQVAKAYADLASNRNTYAKTAILSANWQDGYKQAGRFISRDGGGYQASRIMSRVEEEVRSRTAGENALVAAGICGPVTPVYDIPVIGDTDRPVRDALAPIGADRGGITYRPAIDGVAQTGGIGNWTQAQDEADPIVDKVCLEVDCPTPVTAEVEGIYHCLTFSNMSTQFDPEAMDAVIQAGDIAFARFAENKLLTQMVTGSKGLFTPRVIGAARDFFVSLDKFVAYYRSVHRLGDNAPLRMILPLWGKDIIRMDIARQMVGDGLDTLGVADEIIMDWFRRRNVNPTFHLDGIDPPAVGAVNAPAQAYTSAAAGTEVPNYIGTMSTLIYREGDWKYLDGGELNMGLVRDSVLNAQNRFQTFREEFAGPAHRGIESVHLVFQLQVTGQSAATRDLNAITN